MNAPRILVVGEWCIDRLTFVNVSRISPEAPVLIGEYLKTEERIGMAGNVVANLRDLGAEVGFLTLCNPADEEKLSFVGFENLFPVPEWTKSPIIKERIISGTQQLLRIDREDTHYISEEVEKELIKQFKDNLSKFQSVLIQDYGKGMFTRNLVETIILDARKAGKPVFVDPNPRTPWEWYKGCTLFKPNNKECVKVFGEGSNKTTFGQIWELVEPKYTVITCGKNGMVGEETAKEISILLYPTNTDPVDVTGAGDTVIATLAFFLTQNYKFEQALDLANRAAGVVVGKFGTSGVTRDEIDETWGFPTDFTGESF